jgi:FixJ family two-component response regulator
METMVLVVDEDRAVRESISRALRAAGHEVETFASARRFRERQVFALVASGLLNKQVGYELGTSEKTVKVQRSRVVEKLGAGSLADLVRMADRLGLGPEAWHAAAPAGRTFAAA